MTLARIGSLGIVLSLLFASVVRSSGAYQEKYPLPQGVIAFATFVEELATGEPGSDSAVEMKHRLARLQRRARLGVVHCEMLQRSSLDEATRSKLQERAVDDWTAVVEETNAIVLLARTLDRDRDRTLDELKKEVLLDSRRRIDQVKTSD